jgi:hypothetical protein
MLARLIILLTAVFAALIAGAPVSVAEPPAPPAPIIPPPVQPANIGDLKFEATHYYDSGAYLTDLQLATAGSARVQRQFPLAVVLRSTRRTVAQRDSGGALAGAAGLTVRLMRLRVGGRYARPARPRRTISHSTALGSAVSPAVRAHFGID